MHLSNVLIKIVPKADDQALKQDVCLLFTQNTCISSGDVQDLVLLLLSA